MKTGCRGSSPASRARVSGASEWIFSDVGSHRTRDCDAMSVPAPHFLLYAEAALSSDGDDCTAERWRFVLRQPDGSGSRHPNLKELRAGLMRALFAFDPLRQAIVLVGGDKRDDWTGWYERNIPLADDLLDAHLDSLREDPE